MSTITDPEGNPTTISYDANGNLTSTTDRQGQRIDFTYDGANRLTQKTLLPGTPEEAITTFGYDLVSNLTSAVDPDSSLAMTYDPVSRLTSAATTGFPNQPEVIYTRHVLKRLLVPLAAIVFAMSAAGARVSGRAEQTRAVIVERLAASQDIPADRLLQTGHTERVSGLAFSPEGRWLLSAGQDRTLRIWDSESGVQLHRLEHNAPVTAIVVSPAGRRVVSATSDGTLTVWRLADGTREFALPHRAFVSAFAFDPTGTYLAAVGGESVAVWNLDNQQLEWTTDQSMEAVQGATFAPGGRSFLVWSIEGDIEPRGRIQELDASTGQLLDTRNEIAHGASRDGSVLAIRSGNAGLQLIDAQIRTPLAALPLSSPLAAFEEPALALNADRRLAAYVDRDQLIIHDWAGNRTRSRFDAAGHLVALDPDGTRVALATENTKILLIDVASGRQIHALTRPLGSIAAVAFSPDGQYLAAGGQGNGDGAVKIWNLATGRERAPIVDESEAALAVAFSPDGQYLAAGGRRIRIIDTRTGQAVRQPDTGAETVTALLFSPDGTKLAAGGTALRVWEIGADVPTWTVPGQVPMFLAFSPDGRCLAAADRRGRVTIYNSMTGQVLRTLLLPSGMPSVLAFNPDGSRLAVGTRTPLRLSRATGNRPTIEPAAAEAATITTWDTDAGELLYTIRTRDWVSALAFTSDDRALVGAFGAMNQPGSVVAWDARTGEGLRVLIDRAAPHDAAAFSPDRIWLAMGSNDNSGVIGLWELPAFDLR